LEFRLKNWFLDQYGRLRNGWWVLAFMGFFALAALAYRPLGQGLKHLGISKAWLEPSAFLISLLATWGCTRLRGEPLASVGFHLNRKWFREAGWGFLLGTGIMVAAAGMVWLAGGVTFELDPARSWRALGFGFYFFLFVGLFEENLFRGFLFQRMVEGMGVWGSQAVLAGFFALAHWWNPGMHGATRFWATLDISLAAVFLGLAYLRTRSLALPVGIHLGWNWAQGYVLGFGVSGTSGRGGWLRPVFQGKAEWLTGGSFGLEASLFGVIAVLLGIALLWFWKGSTAAPATGPASGSSGPGSA
jgi:hypothetical protein